MKKLIKNISNNISNVFAKFFHTIKSNEYISKLFSKIKRLIKRIKRKLFKFYYYEILGVVYVGCLEYRGLKKIYNFKYFVIARCFIKNQSIKIYKNIKKFVIKYYNKIYDYIGKANKSNKDRVFNVKENYSKYLTKRVMAKASLLAVISVLLIYNAYSWFYSEYVSKGTQITLGTVVHEVTQYNEDGSIIGVVGDTLTLVEEDDISNTSITSRYVSIRNTGSLDIDYILSFTLDGTTSNAGTLYYRVYDITDEVLASTITGTYPTKLEAYAAANPVPTNLESASDIPVSNMTTIPQTLMRGTIEKDGTTDENNYRYYRIDWGMYQAINSANYSGASVAIHANVYSVQSGVDQGSSSEGEIWLVENETQFRDAALNALSGDTIKLASDITISGDIDFARRVHLDTDTFNLNITGDLVYDFVEVGGLTIDTSGGGKIDIGSDFYINTPKSQVHFIGLNTSYDIYVGGTFTVNGIQNEQEDGILLESVRIINNKVGNVPVDIIVMSNTRITIAPNVQVGYVVGATGSTNIEIINNGTITQIQLQNMNLIDSFSKYQIYVYNLNTILGVLGGSSIVLPSNSTPYLGPNNGNTLIVAGVSSNDITVSGSDGFGGDDIGQGAPDASVVPIQGEANSYYVYIRSNSETLQGLLEEYFTEIDPLTVDTNISNIVKLVIYTMNSSYFENEDFTYLASSAVSNIEYLSLANATVIDGNTLNRIADNTLANKTTLKTVILSKTTTAIGSGAFENVNLGRINAGSNFTFLSIPLSVTSIGANSFKSARYVNFEGQIPPTIVSGAFSSSTRFFVPSGAISLYRTTTNIDESKVYYAATLSDNKMYFVYNYNDGYGISYFINSVSVGTSLTVPNTITSSSVTKSVTSLGVNAYRGLLTDSNGTAITLPSTLTYIDSYAFYSDNIISINLNNVVTVNEYAFYETNIVNVTADLLTYVGSHAFYGAPITYLSLETVTTIMPYAFYDNTVLYEANLGTVKVIGDYAFYNCPQLGRVWFNNMMTKVVNNAETIDLTIGTNAIFTNWGSYLDGRLRVYVPDGQTSGGFNYLRGYKTLFTGHDQYVYVRGTIIGSYQHVAIPYDWGEYSVRPITINNASGEAVSAYEMIEYHGADLTSSYQLPDVLNLEEDVTASISGSSWYDNTNSVYVYNGILTITNNTNSAISDWSVRINLPTGISGFDSYTNTTISYSGNILTVGNVSGNGSIGALSSRQISFKYNTVSQSISANVMDAYCSTSSLMQIISIGEYAYRHVSTQSGQTIDLVSNTLLNIDEHGLENISISSMTANNLVSVKAYGLHNTVLNYVRFPSINYLGDYAMSGMSTLYSATLGDVQIMGNYAISDNPNLEQVFLSTNNTTNVSISSTAMSNIGTNANDRLRIYVLETNVSYFKALLSSYSDYIYPMGTIVGSFVNTPINYDIGEYSVRLVTIQDVAGNDVSGLEIIEYHGADINNTFTIPTSYELNGTTYNVISISNYAYKHAAISEGETGGSLTNNVIMNIGAHAFDGIGAIVSLTSSSLLYIDDYAFNNGALESLIVPNLYSIGSYAIANMTSTYKLNLGSVAIVEENAMYNLPNLIQTFFDPGSETRVFNKYGFTNVGSLTNDRIRFYVSGDEVTRYDTQTNTAYPTITDSCPRTTVRISGRNRYVYTCTVRITNNTAYTLYDWTATSTNLGIDNYDTYFYTNVLSGASYSASSSTYIFESDGTNDTISPNSYIEFTFGVYTWSTSYTWSNVNSHTFSGEASYDQTVSYTVTDFITSEYANAFRDEYKDYFYDYDGHMMGNYTSSSIPNDIGEYSVTLKEYTLANGTVVTGCELVEYHGIGIGSTYILPTSVTINGTAYDVIGVGDRAFKHAEFNNSAEVDIVNSTLYYIDDYAFYNKGKVHIINLNNVEFVGDYALMGNKLYTVNLPKLNTIESYALANNTQLNYLNLGTVASIGTNAFYGCTGVEQIFFTSTNADTATNTMLITIGDNAFYNCGSLIGDRFRIYVPNGTTTTNGTNTYQSAYKNTLPSALSDYIFPTGTMVGSYTFGLYPYDIGVYSVRTVTVSAYNGNNVTGYEIIEYHGADIDDDFPLPSSLTVNSTTYNVVSIGPYAFRFVTFDTTYEMQLPLNIAIVGAYAFYGGEFLRVEGGQIRTLDSYSFAECDTVRNFILDAVNTVSDHALYGMDSIVNIQLGQGVSTIGAYALWNPYPDGPTTLLSMYVQSVPTTASTALPDYEEVSSGVYQSNFSYAVPLDSVRQQLAQRVPWMYHTQSNASYFSDYLYVLYPNAQGTGGYATLVGYTGTDTDITIWNGFVYYGQYTYYINKISADAFDNNTQVESITLSSYIESVEPGFLSGNSVVENLYVNSQNTYFSSNDGVLYSRDGTQLIKYPNGKTATTYTIPTATTTIGYEAFANQTHLQSITLNSNLTTIGTYAFKGCTSLNTYTFNSAVPKLTGFYTFADNGTGMAMNVPNTYLTNYRNNMYFKDYYDYLTGY